MSVRSVNLFIEVKCCDPHIFAEGGSGRHGEDDDQEPVGPPRQQPPPRGLPARPRPPPALAGGQARARAQPRPLGREQAGPDSCGAGHQGELV